MQSDNHWHDRLVSIASDIADGNLDFVAGLRLIVGVWKDAGQPAGECFDVLRALESDTDHFPVGEVRRHCTIEYLAAADAEKEQYFLKCRDDLLAACSEIIQANYSLI